MESKRIHIDIGPSKVNVQLSYALGLCVAPLE